MAIVKDLGMVTAYAYAVAGGYEGTEAEFTELLGQAGVTLEQLESLSAVAVTLAPGSEATASYSDGVLTFGIPQGATGETGQTGPQGPEGPTGNGIVSIAKTGTSGLIDTYTITFTNGNTTTFTVTNGEDGTVTPEQMAAAIADALDTFSGETHEYLTAGMAEQLLSDVMTTDKKPYKFRRTGADATREYDMLVGGSVVANQLYNKMFPQSNTVNGITFTVNDDGSITANGTSTNIVYYQISDYMSFDNHVAYLSGCPSGGSAETYRIYLDTTPFSDTGNGCIDKLNIESKRFFINIRTGVTVNNLVFRPQIIDLTKMLPSAIADNAYTLEQAASGSGIAWLKSYGYLSGYKAYNAGAMAHVSGVEAHVMTGFNQWDEETESGYINPDTGAEETSSTKIRMKNYMPVIPDTVYYITAPTPFWHVFFDKDKHYVGVGASPVTGAFTTPGNAYYMRCGFETAYGTTYKHDTCINISKPAGTPKNGDYVPYVKHSYTIDNTVTLRGIPKLSDGEIYYDGDTYAHDGTVTRRYAMVDLGTLTYTRSTSGLFTTTSIGSVVKHPTNSNVPTYVILSADYVEISSVSITGPDGSTPSPNMVMAINTSGTLYFNNTAYTDAADFKTAVSGKYLLYEVATPTTESATPYQSPQICDPDGTEQYITDGIPVGHTTDYPANLKGEIERIMVQVPKPPTSNGTYTLKCTVAASGVTYAWTT